MADARSTANHMLIEDIDHECTKVVCNMAETARVQSSEIGRSHHQSGSTTIACRGSSVMVVEVTHHRDGLDLDGT